ncbi:hypothetical protein U9M48_011648 [Paspalum notatum var. saurae]|uniref:ALOG domain-containing protein n=1 Tax=Paspalum notatum var. saurae TaxID=547442 RepID=A0AAQ3WHB1_PASNO
MSTSGVAVEADSSSPPPPARRPSRYESQKRRDWQTFTRYLGAHRPPLQLRRCSGAHVLEFLRHLDRFGKTRVHAPPCPAYGGGGGGSSRDHQCQCPLRQAWGSLDALVGRLRAAFDERHGGATAAAATNNPFAARAVRLYLRDVRDAQSRARGISYARKKKKRSKQLQGAAAGRPRGDGATALTPAAAAAPPATAPQQPTPQQLLLLPPDLSGGVVPFEMCCDDYGSVLGGPPAAANGGAAGFYLPLLFNTFG